MNVHSNVVKAEVWISKSGDNLHDGPAIEYVITVANGRPQSYQRTVYNGGSVQATKSSTDVREVPQYVRDEVEKQMVPRGEW